ncbi:MAG: RNA methyltransferase [Betaproteobacteria bacterium]|nr:RNA methyltransferase [Betaproteobacteria bacterium]MDE2422828.1 RNA methyltransferase [Betaproteobacteria bacterium]
MKIITSTDNPLIRQIMRLTKEFSYREEVGQAVIEGIHLVEAALKSNQVKIHTLVVDKEKSTNQELMALVNAYQGEWIEVPQGVFKKISTLTSPDGLLAVVDIKLPVSPLKNSGFCLVLDSIQDPGNVGTLLRSAAASGFNKVVLSPGCAHAWSPKVIRAGMGAHFILEIHEQVALSAFLVETEQPIWLAALSVKSKDYRQLNLSSAFTLVIGNEGSGIDPSLLDHHPHHLNIPMMNKVESLNAAIAGSIIMFESLRQRL